jgi:pSer/pThr/pTyr-binding forkhead associated (FHA) protein
MMMNCPSCGASIQADASFCGQCGFNLQAHQSGAEVERSHLSAPISPDFAMASGFDLPDLAAPEPLIQPDPLVGSVSLPVPDAPDPSLVSSTPSIAVIPESSPSVATAMAAVPTNSQTQLQTQVARLLHVQTNTLVELPVNLAVIHIGKPNDRIPPDVDVSGFPHSEIVSRIHADIRIEGDIYYIEDVGSSNGTYINNSPLPSGNRHRLRPGDRIALGKGDKVTFLFQIS